MVDHRYATAPTAPRARRAVLALIAAVIGFGAFMPVAAATVEVPIDESPASATAESTGDAQAESVTGGYQLVASDGGIFSFGDASYFGSTGGLALTKPIVGMAPTASGDGYWLVGSDGGVFSFGDATFHGSTGGLALTKPIVGTAATATGDGYWLVGSDGGVFSFGDATFHGSTGALALQQPIVGMAVTASGSGYWLVASDGGIFSFGDASYFGSTGALALAQPIVGMAITPSSAGYWLVAADGGIFSFGDADYFGSAGALTLNKPVVGMRATQTEVPDHVLPATQLAFITQPVDSTGGSSFAVQPTVEIEDATGARVVDGTHDVSIRLTAAAGATLACDATETPAVAGVATFAGCSIDRPGTYTLTATSGALDATVSVSTTITVGAAAQLHFGTQPSGGVSSTPFATQPVVIVQDAGGNTVTTDTSVVTLALTTPAGAALACTGNPKAAVAGIATFAGCNVNLVGTYTITATDGALTAATSDPLTVTAGPAVALSFVSQPVGSAGGVAFATQPRVALLDAGGNAAVDDTSSVSLDITVQNGGTLSCASNPQPVVSGMASFTDCNIDLADTYTLTATDGALPAATSDSFVISAGAATALAMVTAPTGGATGADWTVQPVLRFVDAFGNTATSSTDLVTIEIVFGPPDLNGVECGANPQAAVDGVVAFAHCTINTAHAPPSTWSLQFTSVFGSVTAPVTEH